MIPIRRADPRGPGKRGWLTRHPAFSLGDDHDLEPHGFGDLPVSNADPMCGGGAAPPSRAREIAISVLAGTRHREDKLGHGSGLTARDGPRPTVDTDGAARRFTLRRHHL